MLKVEDQVEVGMGLERAMEIDKEGVVEGGKKCSLVHYALHTFLLQDSFKNVLFIFVYTLLSAFLSLHRIFLSPIPPPSKLN